jgi:hypothetical protein
MQIIAWETDVSLHLEFDGNDNVTEIRVVNNSPRPRTVVVTRPNGKVLDVVVAAGQTLSHTLRGGQRFKYAAETADWTVELV